MTFSSCLRVLFALFVSASAFGSALLSPAGVGAQSENGFVMDATRLCGEDLGLRWDASNVEKIEFSVTDTSLNWTTGWIEATDFESRYHFEPVGQRFDKVNVRVTYSDGNVAEFAANIGACETGITTPWPSLEDGSVEDGGEVVTPGGGGPAPADGSFNDPVTGNIFAFLSALRMCEDNRLVTTWSGNNISDIDITIYNPSPGWGTDWLPADADSGRFSTAVERDTAYFVDAAVTFTDESSVIVKVHVPDCTSVPDSSDEITDAGIGESSLRVQFDLPGGVGISGEPYSLFAPQAAAQAITAPFMSGFVGADNTIAIDGLAPGVYRLAVYPADSDPIEALITIGDQPVTEATVTVNADGTVAVAYAAQVVPTPSPAATQAPGGSAGETDTGVDSSDASASASGVSGLPSTGTGNAVSTGLTATSLLAAAVLMVIAIPAGILATNRQKR